MGRRPKASKGGNRGNGYVGRFVRRYGDLIAADDAQSEDERIQHTGRWAMRLTSERLHASNGEGSCSICVDSWIFERALR